MDSEPMVLEDRLQHFIQWLAERELYLCNLNGADLPMGDVSNLIQEYVNE